MSQQSTQNKPEKRQRHPKRADFAVERKAFIHSNPCTGTDWSGIARAPSLVGVSQYSERQCPDKADFPNLGKERVELCVGRGRAGNLEEHRKTDGVDHDQNAKETDILKDFAAGDPEPSPHLGHYFIFRNSIEQNAHFGFILVEYKLLRLVASGIVMRLILVPLHRDTDTGDF